MEEVLNDTSWEDLINYIIGLSEAEWRSLIENLPPAPKRTTLDELQTIIDKEDGYGKNR